MFDEGESVQEFKRRLNALSKAFSDVDKLTAKKEHINMHSGAGHVFCRFRGVCGFKQVTNRRVYRYQLCLSTGTCNQQVFCRDEGGVYLRHLVEARVGDV